MHNVRLAGGIAIVLLALAGCQTSSDSGVQPSGQLIGDFKALLINTTSPVADFKLKPSSGEKALGSDTASVATSADAKKMRAQLDQSSFEGGFERIFTRDTEYITVLVLDFQVAQDAANVTRFEETELSQSGGTIVVKDPALDNAWAYDIQGKTRAGAKTVYCGGEWFYLDHYAFDVNYCGFDYYTSGNLARLLARQQYQKAGLALGLLQPPPTPTPNIIKSVPTASP